MRRQPVNGRKAEQISNGYTRDKRRFKMAVHLNRQEGMPPEIEEIVGRETRHCQSEEPLEGLRYALFKVSSKSRSRHRVRYRANARVIWPRQRLLHLRI